MTFLDLPQLGYLGSAERKQKGTTLKGQMKKIAEAASLGGVYLDPVGSWMPLSLDKEEDATTYIKQVLGSSYVIEVIPGFVNKPAVTHMLVSEEQDDRPNEHGSWIMSKEMFGRIIWCPVKFGQRQRSV